MNSSIDCLLFEAGKAGRKITIEPTLENLQDITDGYIDIIHYSASNHLHDYCIVLNDEGKILDMRMNRALKFWENNEGKIYDVICGNFIICNPGEDGELASLSKKDMDVLLRDFPVQYFIEIKNENEQGVVVLEEQEIFHTENVSHDECDMLEYY